MSGSDGRCRIVIEGVQPEIDGGRFPAKSVVGATVRVEADVFTDGHDLLSGVVHYRRAPTSTTGPGKDPAWSQVPLIALVNDRWYAEFPAPETGLYVFTLEAWTDHFRSWRRDLQKRLDAGTETRADFQIGAAFIEAAAERAVTRAAHPPPRGTQTPAPPNPTEDALRLRAWAEQLREPTGDLAQIALDPELAKLAQRYPDRSLATRYHRELSVLVERPRAGFSTWYELFPRSAAAEPGRHGTFRDVAARLPEIAKMGFDVVYLPPIHPIGDAFRKGKNNTVDAQPGDVGSPWAIGGKEGGHKAIHPALGTAEDFRALVRKAHDLDMEIALDIAFQCSPDHPYVREHPEWFLHRPDGTVQYAENPPKKYQDIYPFNFECEDWQALWTELKSVFTHWIAQGVQIFRVDNPHTKPFAFWEWVIAEIKKEHPDVLFLAEAFTRPKVMYRLAKLGFSQSYTYFTWRNTKYELTEYFTELTATRARDLFRPNAWPNTPDILPEYLQIGGRPAFIIRYTLAATLCANVGIYGPAYELCENQPIRIGSEEYLNSEKYEIRHRDRSVPWNLTPFITQVNRIRRENPALHHNRSLRFHATDNDHLICYSKATPDRRNVIVTVVNLDFRLKQVGFVDLDLEALGVDSAHAFEVHDLLTDQRFLWEGRRNYVELDPHATPAHVLLIRPRVRLETDFDYFFM